MTNLVFDYDGTLHDSIKIYAPSFRKAQRYLQHKKLITKKEYTDEEISRWLGFTSEEMWENFAPGLPDEEKQICSRIIGDEMIQLTLEGKASLYPQAKDILHELKRQGFNLLFLSNCKTSYMEAHKKYFELDRYFSAFYCSEDFCLIPKHEIFVHIKDEWQGDFIIIGDRYQDMEIARRNKLKAIGCLYGYGNPEELQSAIYRIDSHLSIISAIKAAVNEGSV